MVVLKVAMGQGCDRQGLVRDGQVDRVMAREDLKIEVGTIDGEAP